LQLIQKLVSLKKKYSMSSQINFYMMPDDVAELDDYLKNNGWVIISSRSKTSQIEIINSISDLNQPVAYLALKNKLNLIQTRFSEQQNCFFIAELDSEVIQYRKTVIIPEQQIINSGRLYYSKAKSEDTQPELVSKNTEFLLQASQLFSWFKKHFKNTHINSKWTTTRAAEYFNKIQKIPA